MDSFKTTTAFTTIFVVLISIPRTRSYMRSILSVPYAAIRILANTFEEEDAKQRHAEDSIQDDDDDESEIRQNPKFLSPSIFHAIWTILMEQLRWFVEWIGSMTGFQHRLGEKVDGTGRVGSDQASNSRGVQVKSERSVAWPRSKPAILQKKKRKTLQNIAMPLHDQPIMKSKSTKKNSTKGEAALPEVSFDIHSLEPTFLHEDDYPDDWVEYDPTTGELVRRKSRSRDVKNVAEMNSPSATGDGQVIREALDEE